jgi:hypothetical protein
MDQRLVLIIISLSKTKSFFANDLVAFFYFDNRSGNQLAIYGALKDAVNCFGKFFLLYFLLRLQHQRKKSGKQQKRNYSFLHQFDLIKNTANEELG